jgi:hypothetical protein
MDYKIKEVNFFEIKKFDTLSFDKVELAIDDKGVLGAVVKPLLTHSENRSNVEALPTIFFEKSELPNSMEEFKTDYFVSKIAESVNKSRTSIKIELILE